MKLKIKEFEALAKKRGYRGGKALIEELGAGKYAYSNLKRGCLSYTAYDSYTIRRRTSVAAYGRDKLYSEA